MPTRLGSPRHRYPPTLWFTSVFSGTVTADSSVNPKSAHHTWYPSSSSKGSQRSSGRVWEGLMSVGATVFFQFPLECLLNVDVSSISCHAKSPSLRGVCLAISPRVLSHVRSAVLPRGAGRRLVHRFSSCRRISSCPAPATSVLAVPAPVCRFPSCRFPFLSAFTTCIIPLCVVSSFALPPLSLCLPYDRLRAWVSHFV